MSVTACDCSGKWRRGALREAFRFRRSYESVLQRDTNVGIGTLVACKERYHRAGPIYDKRRRKNSAEQNMYDSIRPIWLH